MVHARRGELSWEVDRFDVVHFTPERNSHGFMRFQAVRKPSKSVLIVDSLTGDAEHNLRDDRCYDDEQQPAQL